MPSLDFKEFKKHFPIKVSKDLADFATGTALQSSRYLFVERVNGEQWGYCTHCKKDYATSIVVKWGRTYLKHNDIVHCPECESVVKVKGTGRGRKYLRDDAYFVWYDKSLVNPQAITAKGIHVIRDYSDDYRNVNTEYRLVALYLFEPGVAGGYGKSHEFRINWRDEVVAAKKVTSEFYRTMQYKDCYLAEESVASAVQGTPFQYSTWEHFLNQSRDLIHFFDLAARYPCVEYLSKLGLRGFIDEKLLGSDTPRMVNWRGKKIDKVIKLSKAEIRDLRSAQVRVGSQTLFSHREFKKMGINLTFEQANILSCFVGSDYYASELEKMRLRLQISLDRVIKYLLKQYKRGGGQERYRNAGGVLSEWRDYLNQCQELGMELDLEYVKFPNDLNAAHDKTTNKIKLKRDKPLNDKIEKRLSALEKYTFEYRGMVLRAARDTVELFHEGKELSHCVGSYSARYANGESDIFLIRRLDDPDKPFYTMEIVNDQIIQCQGLKRCAPTPDVDAFIEAFTKAKLTQKPKKQRGPKPAEQRLEVAV